MTRPSTRPPGPVDAGLVILLVVAVLALAGFLVASLKLCAAGGLVRPGLPHARLPAADEQRQRQHGDGQPTPSLGHRRRQAIPPPPVWDPPTGSWGLTVRWIALTRVLATSSIWW